MKETRDRGDRFRCGLETIVGQIIHLPYRWNLTRLYRTHTSSSEYVLFLPAAARCLLSKLLFVFSLCERKNEQQENIVPLCRRLNPTLRKSYMR